MTGYYVYRIFSGDETVYIGKGSGNRIDVQKKNFGCDGEILERFSNEQDAYAAEVRLIEKLSPPLNRCPGGNGGMASMEGAFTNQRIRDVANWYIETIRDYSESARANLRELHKCKTDIELTAKLIADCVTGQLGEPPPIK